MDSRRQESDISGDISGAMDAEADGESSHRLRWLLFALLIGGIVYAVRTRAAAPAQPAAPRPVPPPDELRPVAGSAARGAESAPKPPAPIPAPAAERPTPRPRRSATATLPAGSAAALPDGSPPGPEYTIKAKSGSELFHGPDSPYFGRTRAEFWFRTAEDARAAGFTEWAPRRRSTD